MKLLRIANTLNSTSAPYNQFTIGFKDTVDQTFCSLFSHDLAVENGIRALDAGGSVFKMLYLLIRLVRERDYDVIHIHSGLTGIIFILSIFPFKLSLLTRTVFTLHNSWRVIRPRNRILNAIVMILCRKICACGVSSRNSIPSVLNYLVGKKTISIVNGFDNNRIDRVKRNKTRTNHFNDDSKLKILYIGALNTTKNQAALLEVLKDSKFEFELIFLGDGLNRRNLVELSKMIPTSVDIKFKGRISRDLAIEHMLEADVCVSLSKGEGLPIAVLESMYSGCFMILSTIPPHLEVSPPDDRCIFVDSSDSADVYNSLLYVKKNLQEIRAGRNKSRDYSIANFSVVKMLGEYRSTYNSL